MTNFKMMITTTGKHPALKWAELAADEIIEISENAPTTKIQEAREFRNKLVSMLEVNHQEMMDHEQDEIKAGRHDMNLPYKTEKYAEKVVKKICALTKGYSFEEHFVTPETHQFLETVLNRNFKSAKLVERSHFHSEKAATPPQTVMRSKKSINTNNISRG
jgi:hypothetical protein